jgi:2-polyprenyl-6-methoxyphenol hydroxylase-like FAD-dependent oxidoreductase
MAARTCTAVVVGAGLAGLAAAGGLARAGWRVILLERSERLRADATGLVLWPNGFRALHALQPDGAWDGIVAPFRDGGVRRPDGQWLAQPRSRAGLASAAVVHQQDLHDALVAGLGDSVEVRTGVAVRALRIGSGRRPLLDDGRTGYEADLVVAADGIDSVVRRRLVPEAVAVDSGFAAWQAVIPGFRLPRTTDGERWHGETLGAGYRFVSVPLGEHSTAPGGVYWVATVAGASRPEAPATQLRLLRRWFAHWHAPIGELLEHTRPEDLAQRAVRELRPLPRAYGFPSGTGGVVLLGDAAHAMPHHLGQGACLAFEDAVTLRSAVAQAAPGPALHAAVEAYSRARRPRTMSIVRQTRRMSAVVQARGRLALRARDAALGSLTPRLLGRSGTTVAWQPPK